MPLTGLDIYKLLPKTNCKKCNFPTCLAFAMAIASKKVSLDKCPDISEEAKLALQQASEPPIRTITLSSIDAKEKLDLGGETVLFRHEKTFYHPCGLGISLSDILEKEQLHKKLNAFCSLSFDRVGQKVKAEFIVVKNNSKDEQKFIQTINEIKSKVPAGFLIILSENQQILQEALKVIGSRVIIGPVNSVNVEVLTDLAKNYNAVLLVEASELSEIATITQKIATMSYREIIIDLSENLQTALENLTQVRRLALKKNFRPFGYPTLVFTSGNDLYEHLNFAITSIAKYASIVILPEPETWLFLPLVTLRQNIYTDPQKPVSVEPKLYTIGGQPTDKSPLMVTTNFSLTYFTVEPEIINSKIPSWLLVVDSDGLSVLTAWAAEKFTPEKIVDAMKKFNVENVVSHRKIIIPGYVAVMSGKLNELSGWEVIVGPREASGIPKFIKTFWQ